MGGLESWGSDWKRYVPLIAPFAVLAWLGISFIEPWIGLILLLLALVIPLIPGIRAYRRNGSLRFLSGVFSVQVLKYVANVIGFWKGVFE